MSNDMNRTVREFYKAVEGVKNKKPLGYDTQATVRRIEDGVAWVHIPDGVDETPARMTISAKVGDVVQVRIVNGRAFLVGNASAPPTDNTEAVKAMGQAGLAAEAASIARQKADEAVEDAATAHEAAMSAQDAADAAQDSADAAQTSADNAQASATTANQAANSALAGLGTVESVLDVVTWFSEHKTATTDTTVQAGKSYYEYDASTGVLTKVDPEGTENPSEEGWYELDEAITNYVSTHLAQTNDGLNVVSSINGWRVLISSGGGNYNAGVYLIDPNGNIAQSTTAAGVVFNTGKPVNIGDSTAYINFDGNGHITVVGADFTIGGANNQSGTLTVKDASGNTIGTWDKDGMYVTSLLNITSSDRTKSISLKYEYAGITKKTLTVDPTTNSQTQNSNLTYETLFTTDDLITGKLYSTGLFYSKIGAYIEGTTDLELLNCPQINTLTLYTYSIVAYGLVDGANLKTTGSLYNQYNNTFIRPNVDNWLRINDLGAYSSGVYFGSSLLRTDGYFQVGGTNPVTQYRNGSIEFTGNVAKATAPSSAQYKNIVFLDNGGRDSYHRLAFIEHFKDTNNLNGLQFGVYNHMAGTSSNSWPIGMRFSIDSNQSGAVVIWGNTTVSGSLLTSSGRLYSRLASGEAQIQADNNGNNKIYMYANSDGRVGIWQMTANGTSGSVISRANNSTMITFGNAAGQVQTYGYNYGAGAPIVSQTDANHRVSHMYCSSTSLLQVCAQTGSSTYTTGLRISLSTSDKRMKENIKDADVNALSILNRIKMRQFDWNVPQEYQHQNIGMIADEIEQIDPHLASGGGYDEDGNMNVKSIDTFYLMGYLVKAVQELSAEIERMKAS